MVSDKDRDFYHEEEETTGVDGRNVRRVYARAQDHQSPHLIVLAGGRAGEICRVERELLVGRSSTADLQLIDGGISKRHLRLLPCDGGVLLVDLSSRNGTFVNGERVTEQLLVDGDKIQLGSTAILKFAIADAVEAQFQQRMHEAATCDPLTGLYNRRRLFEALDGELAYAARHDGSLSLIMVDIDHFKAVNDVHGHPVGDEVLKAIGKQILDCIRREDIPARYGGEEFAIICRGVVASEAAVLAERLRVRIERQLLLAELPDLRVTISAGVAEIRGDAATDGEALVSAADKALYEAKRDGRNLVRISPPRALSDTT